MNVEEKLYFFAESSHIQSICFRTDQWRSFWSGVRIFVFLVGHCIADFTYGGDGFHVSTTILRKNGFLLNQRNVGFPFPEVRTTGMTSGATTFLTYAHDRNERVAVLAPPSCSKFLSYLTGWISVIAWQVGMASGAYLGGTLIQGLLVLNYPTYHYERWHGTLLFYAIVFIALFVNTYLVRLLPMIESIVFMIHVIGFFAILIPLVYFAPHGSVKDVFATFNNGGHWSSTGLSFFIGAATSMFAFVGTSAVERSSSCAA